VLAVAHPDSMEGLPDALADLVTALRLADGEEAACAVLEVSCGRARGVLWKLRHHLYEISLIVRSLEETSSSTAATVRPVLRSRRTLRELAHGLCRRLREKDVPGALLAARSLLACFLDYRSRDSRLLSDAYRGMDLDAARRFSDALFGRLLSDFVRRENVTAREAPAELRARYIRIIRRFFAPTSIHQPFKVSHEYPCRR